MGRKVVPVKTKEGTQEIRARALGLAPRIRTALLLVDGVKSLEELERLMDAAGVTPGALQMLLDKGLIRIPEPEQPETPVLDEPHIVMAPRAAPAATEADSVPHAELPPIAPTVLDMSARRERSQELADHMPEYRSGDRPQPGAPRVLSAPLEVVTLLELETILGAATKMEVATILGVATMLELTPTQMMAPDTAVKAAPSSEPARLPPLARAERELQAKREEQAEPRPVIPAAVLRNNLMAARAHLAAALDEFLEIDGYLLKQKVMACENREELEALIPQLAAAFIKKIEKTAAKRLLTTAESMLDR